MPCGAFYPFEVVYRYHDPQLQMGTNTQVLIIKQKEYSGRLIILSIFYTCFIVCTLRVRSGNAIREGNSLETKRMRRQIPTDTTHCDQVTKNGASS